MPKPSTCFICQSCGSVHSKWAGRCDSCGKWNTLVEELSGHNKSPHKRKKGRNLDFVDLGGESQDLPRLKTCLLYTSPSPRDLSTSRMPSSA